MHRAFLGILVHSWTSLGGAACFRVIADARQQEAHVKGPAGSSGRVLAFFHPMQQDPKSQGTGRHGICTYNGRTGQAEAGRLP